MALFIFPVCANAQVGTGCGDWTAEAPTLLPIEDAFTLTPTFKWVGASGATSYTVTLDDENTFADPTLQTGTATDADCALADHDDDPDTAEVNVCEWTPSTALPGTGDVYWKVGGEGECPETGDLFTLTEVTSDPDTTVTPKVATLSVTAPTDVIRSGDTIPVSVSMTNPGFDATAVSFSVLYDSGKFNPPAGTLDDDLLLDPDLATAGFVQGDIVLDTATSGTVKVTLTGSDTKLVPADIGRLMDLVFTVKDNPTLGDAVPPFTVQNITVKAKPEDTEITVPSSASATSGTAVARVSPQVGDVNGDNVKDLKDAFIPLKVAANVDLGPGVTVYPGADANGDKKVGVADAIYVMDELLAK
jgi:hypothetical protein